MKTIPILCLAAAVAAFMSCVTTSTAEARIDSLDTGRPVSEKPIRADAVPADTTSQADIQTAHEMNTFLANGRAAAASGKYAEAIRNYLTALSLADRAGRSAEIAASARETRIELESIGTSLSLQPQAHWLDGDGVQIEGDCLTAGTERGLNPSVILTFTSGTGKYVIADAPVRFSFITGTGRIVETVTTDEYGQANSSILSFDSPSAKHVIRAVVEFSVPGFTYTFENTFRDFVYLPPARTATLLAAERSALGISTNPLVLDETFNALKGLEMKFSPYNAVLIESDFASLYDGDQELVARFGRETGSSYLFIVSVECNDVRQIEMNGKLYDLYASFATANFRIIRVSDRRIVYSLPIDRVRGQGANGPAAVENVFRVAREQLSAMLRTRIGEIERALGGV